MRQVSSELLDRLPPQNLDAEKGVLGSLMLDGDRIAEVSLIIAEDDFYAEANRVIYNHMLQMHTDGGRIDPLLLLDRLTKSGELETIGGPAYLGEVAQSVPYASHAAFYARLVAKCSKLRRIIRIATDALVEAYDSNAEPEGVISNIEKMIDAANQQREDTVVGSMEIATRLSDRIDAVMDQKMHLGLQTGFEGFDRITGGLFNSEMIMIAARPGKGKSSLAMQITAHIAEAGKMVYVVSLEMPPEDIAQRIVCQRAEVNSKDIRTGKLSAEQRSRFANQLAKFGNLPIHWETRDSINVARIRATAKNLVKKGLRLLVVDYVGLVDCAAGDEKRAEWERQSNISKGFKKLARELAIPVICVCQLNREVDEQERPQTKHLRGSGSWEQDAHVILFVHKPEGGILKPGKKAKPCEKPEKEEWDAELIVAKNRNGETGTVRMFWEPKFTQFSEWGIPVSANRETAFDEFGDVGEYY